MMLAFLSVVFEEILWLAEATRGPLAKRFLNRKLFFAQMQKRVAIQYLQELCLELCVQREICDHLWNL